MSRFWYAVITILWKTKMLKPYGRAVEFMLDRPESSFWFATWHVIIRLGFLKPYDIVLQEFLRWIE
jgi:hypothetical protein